MKIGVFAGSFCPVTLGHVDSIEKVRRLVSTCEHRAFKGDNGL